MAYKDSVPGIEDKKLVLSNSSGFRGWVDYSADHIKKAATGSFDYWKERKFPFPRDGWGGGGSHFQCCPEHHGRSEIIGRKGGK